MLEWLIKLHRQCAWLEIKSTILHIFRHKLIFPLKVTCLEALPITIHQIVLLTYNMTKYAPAETGKYLSDISQFKRYRCVYSNARICPWTLAVSYCSQFSKSKVAGKLFLLTDNVCKQIHVSKPIFTPNGGYCSTECHKTKTKTNLVTS